MKYYSVLIGKTPGIYTTWNDCKENVIGYKNSKYKKFDNYIDAQNFLEKNSINNSLKEKNSIENYFPILSNSNFDNIINVYTDGSCYGNGSTPSYGGYGIYFSENNPLNTYNHIINHCTNNIAELNAILYTFDLLKENIKNGTLISIYTDSEYCIKCFTTYGEKLYKKNWEFKNYIPNLDLIKKGYLFSKTYPNIKFNHIYSHTLLNDIHSISNENADKLARIGLKKSIKLSNNLGDNLFKVGKYKNRKISDIDKLDYNYLLWFYKNNPNKNDTIFPYILKKYISFEVNKKKIN
tara:strand:+ start:4468 stop:5349 length:882 start_codon:yes stop_codon:yes gene_type:complete